MSTRDVELATGRFTVRLLDTKRLLQHAVKHGDQPNMSQAIRHALRETYGKGEQA